MNLINLTKLSYPSSLSQQDCSYLRIGLLLWLTIQMQRAQTLQVSKGHWSDQVDGIPRQSQINQSAHVDKVTSAHFRDEVVSQSQLDSAAVNMRGDKQEALVGAERAERLRKVSAHAVEGTGRDHAPRLPCSNQRRQQAACDQSQPVKRRERDGVGEGSFGRPGTGAVDEVG